MERLLILLMIVVAGVVGFFLLRGVGPYEPQILAIVDYTSYTGQSGEADGIALVDLNPRSRTFGHILQRVPLGPGVSPHHLYFNRDGSKLYTTALGGEELYRVIVRDDRIAEVRPLDATPCALGEGLYFTEDGRKFYLTCMGADRVIAFDARTEQKLGEIEAPMPNDPYIKHPHGIAVNEKIDRMIVTNTISPKLDNPQSAVTVIELSSGRVLSTHRLAKDSEKPSAPVEVFFLPDRPIAYVTAMLAGTLWVAVWNEQTRAFDFRMVDDGTTRGQSWPLEMYVGPDGHLYVSFAQPGVVNVYNIADPTSPRLIKTLPAEPGAHHIAFSENGKYMFVQNNLLNLEKMNAGTISVVDLQSGKLVASVDSFIKRGLQPASLVLLGQRGHH